MPPRCLLGAISLVSFRGLRALGWSFSTSLCFAVLLALIPSAQVIAGWAVGWPYAAAALLAFGGFFTVEGALNVGMSAGAGRAVGQWLVALGLMVVSALIYQPSAMFYVVPLAAALIAQRQRTLTQTARWAGIHLGFVVGTLGLAYCVMTRAVRDGSVRQIRTHCLRASLGREDRLVPAGIAAERAQPVRAERQQSSRPCAVLRLRRPGRRDAAGGRLCRVAPLRRSRGIVWLTALLGLPVFACAVSLIASERYATYRTILAMTAVLLCFLVASMRALTESWGPRGRRMLATVVIADRLLYRATSCVCADRRPAGQ